MLGLLKYPDDFSKYVGLRLPNPKGSFSFRISLKHIIGFVVYYDKIVYVFTQRLALVRKADIDTIFKAVAADNGKIDIQKISWFMPHVLFSGFLSYFYLSLTHYLAQAPLKSRPYGGIQICLLLLLLLPADAEKFQLYKTIESKLKLPVAYRIRQCNSIAVPQPTSLTWRLFVKFSPEKPRYIIVGFQTGKDADQGQTPSLFDHVNLTNIYVMLNSVRYPMVDYNALFPGQHFFLGYMVTHHHSDLNSIARTN